MRFFRYRYYVCELYASTSSRNDKKRILSYDDNNRIIAEETDDYGKINYLYDDMSQLKGFEYEGKTYYYNYEKGVIAGFSDSCGKEECHYEYDSNGKRCWLLGENMMTNRTQILRIESKHVFLMCKDYLWRKHILFVG